MSGLILMTVLLGHTFFLTSAVDDIFTRRYMQPPVKEETNYRRIEKEILDSIIGKGVYDSRIRPSGVNGTEMHQEFDL